MPRDTPGEGFERFCGRPQGAPFTAGVVIVAAHPDDEVIGAASQLMHLPNCTVIQVTDGAPRNPRDAHAAGFATRLEYARARRAESAAALALAGIAAERKLELGLLDQEASLNLVGLVRRLLALLRELRPGIIVTHPYEGGHPDHDAGAFAVHASCRLMRAQGAKPPAIVEMTSYHNRAGRLAVGEFLPNGTAPVRTLILTAAERALKRRMLDCYATQRAVLSVFPVDFERFRPAPDYDFTQAPHPGPLFYEQFDWGMTGDRWRALAGDALAALGIEQPPCR